MRNNKETRKGNINKIIYYDNIMFVTKGWDYCPGHLFNPRHQERYFTKNTKNKNNFILFITDSNSRVWYVSFPNIRQYLTQKVK